MKNAIGLQAHCSIPAREPNVVSFAIVPSQLRLTMFFKSFI